MEGPPMEDANCSKRLKASSRLLEGNQIPSLPNEIWIEILARLPRSCYLNLKLVCRSFKAAVLSPELYKVRKELGNMDERLYILTSNKDGDLTCYVLDPLSRQCHKVPQLPCVIGTKEPHGQLASRGYGVGAVNGCIYVLGGFFEEKSVNLVWRFDPILNCWSEVAPMSVGRAYCHTSVLDGKLYVVGGVSKSRGELIVLHSGEVFDPSTGLWAQISSVPFSKFKHSHSRLVNSPSLEFQVAGLVAFGGKLYAPQTYICVFSFSSPVRLERLIGFGGEVYDPETNSWVEIKDGMGRYWPTNKAGARSNVVLNGQLHGISYYYETDSCRIKIYDDEADRWMRVHGRLDVKNLAEYNSQCLLSDFLGKLHVVTKDENGNIVVMQAEKKASSTSDRLEYMYVWKAIASSKAAGLEKLVSCHVLDI